MITPLDINFDTLKLMGKYALIMVGLLLLIFVLAVITPWIAKRIDSIFKKPGRVKNDTKNGAYNFTEDEINSPFGAQIDDEKINNGDDLDNGKE